MTTQSAASTFESALRKVKSLLAMGERVEGNEAEAEVACRAAGARSHALGLECDDVYQHWGRTAPHAAWCWFVDGWYDSAERSETSRAA